MDGEHRPHPGQQRPHVHAIEDTRRPDPDLLRPADVPLHVGGQAHGHHRQGRRARPTIIDTTKGGVTSDSSPETTEAELVKGHFLVLFCFQQQEHAEDFKVRMTYDHKVAEIHPH